MRRPPMQAAAVAAAGRRLGGGGSSSDPWQVSRVEMFRGTPSSHGRRDKSSLNPWPAPHHILPHKRALPRPRPSPLPVAGPKISRLTGCWYLQFSWLVVALSM